MTRRRDLWKEDPTTLAALRADPANRRAHNPRNLSLIATALKEVGAARSIVIDEDNLVLAGNGVTQAAAEAGLTKLRVVEASGDEIIAVRRRGLTDAQKRALALYDNRTAELATWNVEQLLADQAAGLDLASYWDATELAALLSANGAPKDGLTDPDAVPEVRATEIQRGDLFALGAHRLLCGDATDAADVARVMGNATAAMVFADPPYGMNLDTNYMMSSWRSMGAERSYRKVIGDDHPYDPAHLFAAFPKCPEIILWGADYYAERLPERNTGSWFVWDKANGGDAPNDDYDKMFGSNFELAWSKTRHKRALIRILWKGIFGLAGEDTKKRLHPTQKPTALAEWFFERFTKPRETIADLFLGSGTTVIAAERLQRACAAIELDPPYCQVTLDRWEAFTGQQAQKVGEAVREHVTRHTVTSGRTHKAPKEAAQPPAGRGRRQARARQ